METVPAKITARLESEMDALIQEGLVKDKSKL